MTRKNKAEYTAQELERCAGRIFGRETACECVAAAFRLADVQKATIEETEKLLTSFLNREVQ